MTNIHTPGGTRSHNPSKQAVADPCLRLSGLGIGCAYNTDVHRYKHKDTVGGGEEGVWRCSEIFLNVESRSISLSGTSQLEKFYILSAVLSCKI
jgi:hypothetical protein